MNLVYCQHKHLACTQEQEQYSKTQGFARIIPITDPKYYVVITGEKNMLLVANNRPFARAHWVGFILDKAACIPCTVISTQIHKNCFLPESYGSGLNCICIVLILIINFVSALHLAYIVLKSIVCNIYFFAHPIFQVFKFYGPCRRFLFFYWTLSQCAFAILLLHCKRIVLLYY